MLHEHCIIQDLKQKQNGLNLSFIYLFLHKTYLHAAGLSEAHMPAGGAYLLSDAHRL